MHRPGVVAWVTAQFFVQLAEERVTGPVRQVAHPAQHVLTPLPQVGDARRGPFRVKAQPQHVHRRFQQVRRGPLDWVVTAYGLAYGVGLITGGRLGDRYGRRRMFVTGLALFPWPRWPAVWPGTRRY